ncbi:pullulanase-type alpha-1,6-glucosidase [Actinosynnema pretiosum subsp. pretiosum]|uniref:1,4-alpha-D-glucan glucanohydrolase n=1 Tax=Actinosynnema pretiosum subsp. pretiosum TaxID=103721 RepID=A0AA45LDB6_9PSEU|nr:Neopullulanase [Actinosynnema pretiosum subsp. pretiosum]QUF07153.1 pullulanase-type alpha-1,6-glucosidase [Actinosynnema pretiosum subsp. pretiosum]
MRRSVAALIALVLVQPAAVTHQAQAQAAPEPGTRLAVGKTTDLPPGARAGDQALAKDALRDAPTGERFYFALPDRFANGDPSNDRAHTGGDRAQHGFDPADKGFYHGGDLKGLQQELGYLDDLGTTALWLTPVFRNRWVQGAGPDASAGYHGYWTTDYTSLDPHFGTTDDMRRLIRDAHRRGIKVFFDIVANHTADVIDYAEGSHDYVSSKAVPYLDREGNPVDVEELAGSPDFPDLDPATSFPYTPVPDPAHPKTPDWLNDPALYHNRGDSTFSGESSLQGDFSGLDDLMTEHPRVVAGMKQVFTHWIDTLDIDGYRVDTVKHVNTAFWQALAPYVRSYAAQRGKPDFFVFGEVFDSDPATTSRFTTEAGLQSVLDFPFQSAALDFLSGRGATRLGDVLLADDRYTDADSNASSLPTFLGNHDLGRVAHLLRQNRPDDTDLLDRLKLGNTLLQLWRGNPVVYYGDEQGFAGTGGDKDARQDLFASATPSYAAEQLIGTTRTGADDNHVPDHPLYRQLADLARFTDSDPVWRGGNQVLRRAEGDVIAFSRFDRRAQVEHLVVANAGTSPRTLDVPVGSTALRQVFPEPGPTANRDADGAVRVTVPPLSALVLRATGKAVATKPAPTLVTPAEGTALDDRVELRADGITAPYAQATFAARVDGSPEWTVLGTDDAAPYRVFADLAALPGAAAGTSVEVRVVAKDAAGRVGADGARVALVPAPPTPQPPTGSPDWLVVHYARQDGDYTGWGLHAWGDVESEPTWQEPLPFAGQTPYGRFAWVKLKPGARQVGIIVHRGDEKDTSADRFVDPSTSPQVWLAQGDPAVHPSEAAATGRVLVHHLGDTTGRTVRAGAAEVPFSNGVATLPAAGPVDFTVLRDGTVEATGRTDGQAWVRDGRVLPSLAAAENRAVLHYHRPDGDYAEWTLYHWTGSAEPSPGWNQSRPPDGDDGFGVYWSVPLAQGAPGLSHIIHRGDAKDPGADQFLDVTGTGHEVWFASGSAKPDGSASYVLPPSGGDPVEDDLTKSKAAWVRKDLVVWDVPAVASDGYRIEHGGKVLRLEPSAEAVPEQFPHLRGKPVFRVRDVDRVDAALRGGALSAVHVDAAGTLRHRTGVQLAGVLDDRFAPAATALAYGPAFDGDRVTTRLWAPTASRVRLRLFDAPAGVPAGDPAEVLDLTRDDASGSWSGSGDWKNRFYQYEITAAGRTVVVTDPYSVALAVGSTHSQFADLADPATAPDGWSTEVARGLGANPVEHGITELHVRDFSIGDDSVPEADRGTYRAFTHRDSTGMRHLRQLAEAGLDTVHLLPTFDIATIPERRADQRAPDCDLPSLPPDSPRQQECVAATAADDGFNWGYDPLHYNTPEGSYATDAAQTGAARSREYREMVRSLHANGNKVVLDVVYNHTAASGDGPSSVLDKVVPGYHHRFADDGSIANSTCCANTAPENAMTGKLVVDSVLWWARTYKVDGFRFDLMGHHPKANLLAVRAALDALTPERDGVDGRSIRLYGEGWDFGEVAGNARFEQATQANLAGTGIGTFSDRLRDAVRGGGPFDEDPRVQGLGTGLAGDLNGSPANGDVAARLAGYSDLVKLGMAGNAAGFRFRSTSGGEVSGRDVPYNGAPAGYAAVPADVISYVDAHDNETLFDAQAFKLPPSTPMADRVRMHRVALAPVLLGQGQPLLHAGSEFLRSKSLDRNSYDSGDWFNRYDPSLRDNGFGRGLPPAPDNADKWPHSAPLLADPALKPAPEDMRSALGHTLELLRLRGSSPLFTLGDAAQVQAKLSFPAAEPGVVVAHLDDTAGPDRDPARDGLLVVVNPFPVEKEVAAPVDGWRQHPLCADRAVVDGTSVRVPPRSVVVLER